ncbi:major capsid protein [Microvirus mar5]|uniref:Major capsid protein n=1 Tax=Microvirus mar5 TaxID=2851185 RepID=A0A8F5RBW7_9VIRU|nr:major capsid protein [Microvirus mar5]
MANQFNTILSRIPKYNKFNLSFENKLTAPIGKLIPVMTQEVIPGDYFNIKEEHLIKFQPMTAPILQRVDVSFHAFFVPLRLIWKNSEEFFTGGKRGLEKPPKPVWIWEGRNTSYRTLGPGSLHDYLGFPTIETQELEQDKVTFDALPFRAYAQIYNDYYRDQNLEDEIIIEDIGTTDPSGTTTFLDGADGSQLRTRAYAKDYFTSALPEPQRGPDVTLPIESSAQVNYNKSGETIVRTLSGGVSTVGVGSIEVDGLGNLNRQDGQQVNIDNSGNLTVDVESSTTTIEDFRRALKVQEFYEKMNRGGYRYIEQILNFFGVKSSDARLQRAEYLGGSRTPVIVSQVTQTSQTMTSGEKSLLGDWAGNATSLSNGILCKRRFEEHGFLMVIMSVTPKASYFQGLPRKYQRFDKTDYYWPQFAHIGDQEIKKSELYYSFDNGEDNEAGFGYAPRYAEYRYNPDEIHGEFKDNLLYWHMARKFSSQPSLSNNFMKIGDAEVNRVFAIDQNIADPLLCQLYFNVYAKRKISRYGNPRI